MLGRLQQASRLVKQWAIIDCRTAAGAFSSHAAEARESMQYDVCIVGAGPAGLSAAIKLKQRCKEADKNLSVCVLEKGAEVGAHILSGNVLEPHALTELLPDWEKQGAPVTVPATEDRFFILSQKRAFRVPTPKQMHNKGNYVISLSKLCRWLGTQAEELGVDIYPGFAASELLLKGGAAAGVATNDFGVAKDGTRKPTFQRGLELQLQVVLHIMRLAEGCCGRMFTQVDCELLQPEASAAGWGQICSVQATLPVEGCCGGLPREAMKRFRLREQVQADPQTYALGIKEVWEVAPQQHKPGRVWHTVGYPLDAGTYGGSFLYHMEDNKVALGLVITLDYRDPYMNLFQEFQRWKSHPKIRAVLEGGTCLQYGARSLNEGGLQSIPRLDFPGGALIGCSAGFLNVPKIKGTHTAMRSGIMAANAAFDALTGPAAASRQPVDLSSYAERMTKSSVYDELHQCRNIRPGFKLGLWGGLAYAALDTYIFRGSAPWTLRHRHPDHEALRPASQSTPREYSKPDGQVSFDLTTSLFRSGTNHDHDQPSHLRLRNPGIPTVVNLPSYAGPEQRYCPAGVYEYSQDSETGRQQLQIHAQNCLHCKACSIKDPTQNIKWTVPEGGGGPAYSMT